jgi:hypothetical protein
MSTGTQTQTWTIAQARQVTSKIATDLDQMRAHYGMPSVTDVNDYAEEAALLLAKRYLKTVEYGFKREGVVVFSLKYEARSDGTLVNDDRPGRVPANVDITGAAFYSWLTYSQSWWDLDTSSRAGFKGAFPFQRTSGTEPETGNGYWEENRTYSKNGEGVSRKVFKPL